VDSLTEGNSRAMTKYRGKDRSWSLFFVIGAFCDEGLVDVAKKELKSQINSGILKLAA
jgi:hypothetical protein